MVVGHDDGRCPVGERVCIDLSGMDLGFIDKTYRNCSDGDYLICAVKRNTQKMLLFAVGYVPDKGQNIRRQTDFKSFGTDTTPGELKGGQDSGRLGRIDLRFGR